MTVPEFERQIAAIALLDEPIRRGLYLYVLARRRDVGRDEAARALNISRALAAFHLDKLAEQALLETSYRRLTRRRGPGAGRPAKLYRCSSRALALTLPARRYELAGKILVRAVAHAASSARRALDRAARTAGRQLAAAARPPSRVHTGSRRGLSDVLAVLTDCGFEPARGNGEVRLTNCPFKALAEACRPVVCGMNLALVRGVLTGVRAPGLRAELRPAPGACCVIVRRAKGRHQRHRARAKA
jgi:predicted ArsR family transcriptional regulator